METVASWLRLMRPWHWIKNLLIALPLVFSGGLFDAHALTVLVLAFLSFGFASSAIYIFNDACDADSDRQNPTKKDRPIASGKVSIRAAVALMAVCIVLAILFDAAISPPPSAHFSLVVGYVVLNVLYSRWLKHWPIIDVACLSLGFLLRVLYGGAACGIEVSSWLFLTVLCLAFFFSLGKRRNEIRTVGTSARGSLGEGGYTVPFLDKCMYVFLACGLVFYALWATGGIGEGLSAAKTWFLLASVFVAMVTCMRYSMDIEASESSGDPVTTVISDKVLLACMLLWCVLIFAALYI